MSIDRAIRAVVNTIKGEEPDQDRVVAIAYECVAAGKREPMPRDILEADQRLQEREGTA